jgi:hypothetical protein
MWEKTLIEIDIKGDIIYIKISNKIGEQCQPSRQRTSHQKPVLRWVSVKILLIKRKSRYSKWP